MAKIRYVCGDTKVVKSSSQSSPASFRQEQRTRPLIPVTALERVVLMCCSHVTSLHHCTGTIQGWGKVTDAPKAGGSLVPEIASAACGSSPVQVRLAKCKCCPV